MPCPARHQDPADDLRVFRASDGRRVDQGVQNHSGQRCAFNDEWVPGLTLEELRERDTSGRAVIEEMTAADVFIFSDGGLDASTAVCSVDPSSGEPVFTGGPFAETKEHLGGF
jgi:hypothetical protein